MKRFIPLAAFSVSILLVLFSAPAMEAARDALSLWWKTVLPTLFPFFVCATLLERTGGFQAMARLFLPLAKRLRLSPFFLPTLLLGCIAGYPSGARVAGLLLEQREITEAEAERLGTLSNLCSPMFLMGALCYGMLGSGTLFCALCLSHYGCALVLAAILQILKPPPPSAIGHQAIAPEPLKLALPAAIGEGMMGLIRVGGSIVFFLVLARLLEELGLLALLSRPFFLLSEDIGRAVPGVLFGLLEFTGGCHTLIEAEIAPRLTATLAAFLVSFGGLSVATQAMAFLPLPRPAFYLGMKLLHGLLAGLLMWLLFPALPGDVAAMAGLPGRSPYTANALTGLSLLLASLLGVAVAIVLAALGGLRKQR